MSGMLPLVDILRDATSDAERSDWLRRVPDGVIFRDHVAIRDVLAAAGFKAGAAFLEARLAAVNSVRCEDGSMPFTRLQALNITNIDLDIAVRAGTEGAE